MLQDFGYTASPKFIHALDNTVCSYTEGHTPCYSADQIQKVIDVSRLDEELCRKVLCHIALDIVAGMYCQNKQSKMSLPNHITTLKRAYEVMRATKHNLSISSNELLTSTSSAS